MLTAKHMPKGPKGQKRPADGVSKAVYIMRLAPGDVEEARTDDGKDAAAVALGRKGGRARAKTLSSARRLMIARKAARSRWKKRKA
jgi:hypothetical protein